MGRLKPRMPTFQDLLKQTTTREESHEIKDMSRRIIRGTIRCVSNSGEHQIDPNKSEDSCILCGTMVEDFEMKVAEDAGGKDCFCRKCGEWISWEEIKRKKFNCSKCGYDLFMVNRIGAREKWERGGIDDCKKDPGS